MKTKSLLVAGIVGIVAIGAGVVTLVTKKIKNDDFYDDYEDDFDDDFLEEDEKEEVKTTE